MSIDIHAFRSMAAQSPDKAIYISGDTLKATRNAASKSVDKFRKELTRIINHPDATGEARRLAERAFSDSAASRRWSFRKYRAA